MTTTRPLLRLSGLTCSLPGGRLLFSNLDLTVGAGEFVAIMGESGVGKSTLLNLIAGLTPADSGTIEVDGQDIAQLSEIERSALRRDRIGFVFQAFHILPHLTLAQNVALPLVLQRRPAASTRASAEAFLDAVGLSGRFDDFPKQLSGGELQRVAIARAVVHAPALILADEPTGNLDPQTAARILELFAGQVKELAAGTILVTHSELAASCADRVMRLTACGLVPA